MRSVFLAGFTGCRGGQEAAKRRALQGALVGNTAPTPSAPVTYELRRPESTDLISYKGDV